MGVGHDTAVGGGIDTGPVGTIGKTGFEDTVPRVVGIIVDATNAVVDVLAVMGTVFSCRITGLEAESTSADEAGVNVN